MIRRATRWLAGAVVLLGCLGPVACDDLRRELPSLEEPREPRVPLVRTPDALLVRFEQSQGVGFSREGWEMEILQMGSEVRVRGSVRTAGTAVPVFRNMGPAEYESFWQWIETFPFDGYQVQEDETAPPSGWTKSLEVDVVLDADHRLGCRNEWERPVVGAPWLTELEDQLHHMVLDYAEAELDRMPRPGDGPDDVKAGIRRALEALGDAEPTNLPGGAPDAD